MPELESPVTEAQQDQLRELLWALVQPTPHNVSGHTEDLERSWTAENHTVEMVRKRDAIEVEVGSEDTELLMRQVLREEDPESQEAQVVGWRVMHERGDTITMRAGRDQLYTAFLSYVYDPDEENEDAKAAAKQAVENASQRRQG